jgi:2Fe-2S ferredoxin
MVKITCVSPKGDAKEMIAEPGECLMNVIVNNDIPGVIGECGGCRSCATCHVYIADAWLDRMPPRSAGEDDLLEGVLDRRPNSRLSCQIVLSDALDGLIVHAPESQI